MSPERRQFRSTAILKNNYHGEGSCVSCLKYKGKEVGGRKLKLHRLTVDKKLRKVRWSPLSETDQKSDSMFATIIRNAFFFFFFRSLYFIYFISDRQLSPWHIGQPTTPAANSKHWFTTSFLQPLLYLVTSQVPENCQLTSSFLLVLKQYKQLKTRRVIYSRQQSLH